MDNKNYKIEELMAKIERAKKTAIDLSKDEDLSLAVMNLISLEEHFFFTAEKTAKKDYFDFLNDVRDIRKKVMAEMIDKNEGETWCVIKHLLATTMRLMEVGTKLQSEGKKDKAKEFFDYAYKVYSLFWGLKLKLIDIKDLKIASLIDKPWTVEDIVSKLVNCCDE